MAEQLFCACPCCEYDVFGVADLRCPECGQDLTGWCEHAERVALGGSATAYDIVAACIVLVQINLAISIFAAFVIGGASSLHWLAGLVAFVLYFVVVAEFGARYGRSVCLERGHQFTHARRIRWMLFSLATVLVPVGGLLIILIFVL